MLILKRKKQHMLLQISPLDLDGDFDFIAWLFDIEHMYIFNIYIVCM